MNIRHQSPAAVTSQLTEAQIRNGFELHVDHLSGDVSFTPKQYYEWRGTFQGRGAVVAAHNELAHMKALHWP